VITIRKEQRDDNIAIEALTISAFQTMPYSSHTEHFIINALREKRQLSIALVATDANNVVAYIAILPVKISDGSANWYGL